MIPENYLGLDGPLNMLLQSNDLFALAQKWLLWIDTREAHTIPVYTCIVLACVVVWYGYEVL